MTTQIILIAKSGKLIRMKVSDISVIGRNTQGVKLFELEPGESVSLPGGDEDNT